MTRVEHRHARISGSEAHVWVVDPCDVTESALDRYRAILSVEERDRMRRFCFGRERFAFLVAHGLTRTALSWCMPGVDPARWRFAVLPGGRPEIDAPSVAPHLRFNLSHTDGLVGCVVVQVVDCGLDLEVTSRQVDLGGLRRMLAPAEREALRTMDPDGRAAQFMRHWTLKEAYAKATGLGLALPFDRVDFDLGADGRIELSVDARLHDDGRAWQLEQWWPSARHTAALALRRRRGAPLSIVHHVVPAGTSVVERWC